VAFVGFTSHVIHETKNNNVESLVFVLVARRDGSRMVFFVNHTPSAKTIGDVTTNADVATWSITKDGTIADQRHTRRRSFSSR